MESLDPRKPMMVDNPDWIARIRIKIHLLSFLNTIIKQIESKNGYLSNCIESSLFWTTHPHIDQSYHHKHIQIYLHMYSSIHHQISQSETLHRFSYPNNIAQFVSTSTISQIDTSILPH